MFSPYYAASGRGEPENHCALNVALYGARHHRWTMTERGARQIERTTDRFAVGSSCLSWRGDQLIVEIVETAAPIPAPVRGVITITPQLQPGQTLRLDASGRHRWSPIAPRCRIDVRMASPGFAWRGDGYLDANQGDEPLEQGFRRWDWARAHDAHGCMVAYRGAPRDGSSLDMMLQIGADGTIRERPLPPLRALTPTVWGIQRAVRADAAKVTRTFEDAPFYARSELDATFNGCRGKAVHESLDLDRFSQSWVRALLPVRMPRRAS